VSSKKLSSYGNSGLHGNQRHLKSPFEKGGLRGISGAYKIPPNPPFSKGGINTSSIRLISYFSTVC
jgi:hypothetical protein